ncbi:MAG TPA: DUF2946 family protein [Albitalea sp.]|uniref:DUF2946 family protein n=1 Tax=Piscinibacter sp. TaxID=1903157 RepID=UPI002ED1659F
MAFLHPPRPLQRRFGWLLWLALLLPLAQGAAACHALSHTRADLAGDLDGKATSFAHCDLCLAAAAVSGGGAPAGEAPVLPTLAARHAHTAPSSTAVVSIAPAHPYRSRAPPFA